MLVRPTTLLGILLGSAASAQVGGPATFRMAALDAVAVQASGSSRVRMAGFRIVGQQAIGDAKARPSIAFTREIGAQKSVFETARTEAVARVSDGSAQIGSAGIGRLHRIATGAAQPNVTQLHTVAARRLGLQIIKYAALSCVTASA